MQNRKRWFSIIFSFLAVSLLTTPVRAQWKGDLVAGEYIVKLRAHLRDDFQPQKLSAALDTQYISLVSRHSGFVLIKKPLVLRTDAVLQELNNHEFVEYAEPNFIYSSSAKPNDPKLSSQWGLINRSKGVDKMDIGAEQAWDLSTGSDDIIVGVIDTGINYNDRDLAPNMWINFAELHGSPNVDDDGNGYNDDIHGYDFANNDGQPMDDNDHGSHCAGIIGAAGNNEYGVVGVNWSVKLMALKFLDKAGNGDLEAALKAIDYAIDQKVDVLNASWGGRGFSQALQESLERAEKAGILFVAAAGNDHNNNDLQDFYPANYKVGNIVTVAAIDDKGYLAEFSNFGKNTVHLAAPGVDILSTGKSQAVKMSGTSMAAPFVSGVAALLLAREPTSTYEQVKERLFRTARRKVYLRNKVTYGVVNAYYALTNTEAPTDPNDPGAWDYRDENLATAHPYPNKANERYSVTVSGAKRLAVHFKYFETEGRFDKVVFEDAKGKTFGEKSGSDHDSYSVLVPGDTLILRLLSDESITRYGFLIDKVSFEK